MAELLLAMGRDPSLRQTVWFVAAFSRTTACFLCLWGIVHGLGHSYSLAIHVVGWCAWFCWQGWFFALRRERYLLDDPAAAYALAFHRDILPGASFAISQFSWPVLHSLMLDGGPNLSAWQALVGSCCLIAGIILVAVSVRAIGLAGAAFVFEYRRPLRQLVEHGIYGYIRHPILLGAVLVSLGSSLLVSNLGTSSLALLLLNVAIMPVYGHLEDARLVRVFGTRYQAYQRAVHGFLPLRTWVRRWVEPSVRRVDG